MGITDHLRELRNRLIVAAVFFVIAFAACFYMASTLVDILQIPAQGLYDFIYISPSELFMQYLRVGLIAGLVISSPVIVYEIMAFVMPGLKNNEKSFIMGILILGTIFFILGVIFAFAILLPIMMQFFMSVNNNSNIVAQISIKEYLSLVITMLFMMGLVFELPIIVILLTQLGFLKPEWLKKSRRVVIVLCFVLGSLLTPPDVISQILLAVPMMALFEVSIIFSSAVQKRKDRRKLKQDQKQGLKQQEVTK